MPHLIHFQSGFIILLISFSIVNVLIVATNERSFVNHCVSWQIYGWIPILVLAGCFNPGYFRHLAHRDVYWIKVVYLYFLSLFID